MLCSMLVDNFMCAAGRDDPAAAEPAAAPAKCTMPDVLKASRGDISGLSAPCRACLAPCASKTGADQLACGTGCASGAAPAATTGTAIAGAAAATA